jgi:cation transport ATPase
MWRCPKCSEDHEDTFDACWNCGTEKDGQATEEIKPEQETHVPAPLGFAPVDVQLAISVFGAVYFAVPGIIVPVLVMVLDIAPEPNWRGWPYASLLFVIALFNALLSTVAFAVGALTAGRAANYHRGRLLSLAALSGGVILVVQAIALFQEINLVFVSAAGILTMIVLGGVLGHLTIRLSRE